MATLRLRIPTAMMPWRTARCAPMHPRSCLKKPLGSFHGFHPRIVAERLPVRSSAQATLAEEPAAWEGVKEGTWTWKGHKIRYQRSGDSGPAVLMIHGFGANADHWRKNTPVVGEWGRAYSIDLLGYGYSDKPTPSKTEPNQIYNFESWAEQLEAFVDEVVGAPVVVTANSVGGLCGLVFAHNAPKKVRAVQLINISLRMLHVDNQSAFARPLVAGLQKLLRTTTLGEQFFSGVATPKAVKNVLSQAYGDSSTVTDELVECVLKPGLQPGAAEVFLDFISYSSGPLPGPLIQGCPVPVEIVWGADDPWEKVEWGRKLAADAGLLDNYTELPGVGHCPQDEAPDQVNPLIEAFAKRYVGSA